MRKIILIITMLVLAIGCTDNSINNTVIVENNYYVKVTTKLSGDNSGNSGIFYFDGNLSINPMNRMFCNYGKVINISNRELFWGTLLHDWIPFQNLLEQFGCLTKYIMIKDGKQVNVNFIYDEEKYLKMIINNENNKSDSIVFFRNGKKIEKIFLSATKKYWTFEYIGENISSFTNSETISYKYINNLLTEIQYPSSRSIQRIRKEYDGNKLLKDIYYCSGDSASIYYSYINNNLSILNRTYTLCGTSSSNVFYYYYDNNRLLSFKWDLGENGTQTYLVTYEFK